MKLEPLECIGSVCQRKIFDLKVVGNNKLNLTVNARYQNLIIFEPKSDIILDTTSKLVLCSMIFAGFNDPSATCYFRPIVTSGVVLSDYPSIEVTASETTINWILKQTSTQIY